MFLFHRKKDTGKAKIFGGISDFRSIENPFEMPPKSWKTKDEKEVEKKRQKVESATKKLKEKYAGYRETLEFIEYLRATELFFAQSLSSEEAVTRIKKETILFDIQRLSEETKIERGVFEDIYLDFQKAQTGAGMIFSVADILKKKYSDSPDVVAFIFYLRDIFSMFSESAEKKWTLDAIHEHLIRVQMQFLCSNGYPELRSLEEVYKEFRSMLL